MTVCHDCGSRSGETAFPVGRRRAAAAKVPLCCDCIAERARASERGAKPERIAARSRASYRAALRHRQKLPQLDLIDLIMPVP